jgi:hypothetical protein
MNSKATNSSGVLEEISDCYIQISKSNTIPMRIIPDISDGKGATYGDETAIGRSIPIKTFSHGENRTIGWTAHFMVCEEKDIEQNLKYLRSIQSLVYPRDGGSVPYAPPPVCNIRCGKLLGETDVCAVLKSYSVRFPPDVPWDHKTKLPYKFSIDMSWEVVYKTDDLPGQERILNGGRR